MIVHRKQIKIHHFTMLRGQTLFANFLTNMLVVPILFPVRVLENIPDLFWQLPLTNGQQRSLASPRPSWEGLTCEPGLFFHLASADHNALIVTGRPLAPGYHLAEALYGLCRYLLSGHQDFSCDRLAALGNVRQYLPRITFSYHLACLTRTLALLRTIQQSLVE